MDVAIIVSKWHLSNLEAYLLRSGKELDLLIITPQSNIKNETGYRISVEDIEESKHLSNVKYKFEKIGFNIVVLFRNLIKSITHSEGTNIISPGNINFKIIAWEKLIGKPEFTIIDEGTASYVRPIEHLKIASKTVKSLRITDVWHFKLKLFLKNLFLKNFKINNELLFKKNTGFIFNVNTQIARSLNTVYSNRNSNKEFRKTNQNEKRILLILDLYECFGDKNYFLSLYRNIVSSLVNKCNVYIKPHPNDLNKYQFEKNTHIIDSKQEIESVIPVLQPDIIIGGISTSTYTIPAIFDIKTISLLGMYLECKNLDEDYRKRFIAFNQLSSDIVVSPKSVESMKNEL